MEHGVESPCSIMFDSRIPIDPFYNTGYNLCIVSLHRHLSLDTIKTNRRKLVMLGLSEAEKDEADHRTIATNGLEKALKL